jgi:hypothetical protein
MRLSRRNNSPRDETIFDFDAEPRKRRMVISSPTKTAASAGKKTGDSQMRTLSFLLAFAVVLARPTLAGPPDGSLPGFGTFAYNGSPIVTAGLSTFVAAR